MPSGKDFRWLHVLSRTLFAILGLTLVFVLAGYAINFHTRKRAERLLRDLQTLKIGTSTAEDAMQIVTRYGGAEIGGNSAAQARYASEFYSEGTGLLVHARIRQDAGRDLVNVVTSTPASLHPLFGKTCRNAPVRTAGQSRVRMIPAVSSCCEGHEFYQCLY